MLPRLPPRHAVRSVAFRAPRGVLVRSGVAPSPLGLASRVREDRGTFPAGPPSRGASTTPLRHLQTHGLLARWDDAHYGLELPDPAAAGRLLYSPGLL
jgi:hypothetical protein